MIPRKAIWLFGFLLVIAVLSLGSPLVKAQEGTPVTMGPWRVLKGAGEITLYLDLPPGYTIDHTRQTKEGGPLLYIRGPATEHQKVWRSKGRGIFVGIYSVPNPEQLSLQQLLEKKVQKLRQQFKEPEYVVESLEDGTTKINGYDACYVFNVLKHMEVAETYGSPSTACDFDIFTRLDDYHPSLPGGALYLLIKGDFWEMQYPEEDIPVLREDLNHIFHSLHIEVGATLAPTPAPTPTPVPPRGAGGGAPILLILVTVVVIVIVLLVIFYFRRHKRV